MKKLAILSVLSLGLWTASAQICVKNGGTGNGSDWQNAIGDLQQAINLASTMTPTPDIWVEKGTYTPSHSINNPSQVNGNLSDPKNTFYIANASNLKIYGGFVGNEIRLSDRPADGKSILMGEIIGAENAVLDGCEIVINATKEDGEKKN